MNEMCDASKVILSNTYLKLVNDALNGKLKSEGTIMSQAEIIESATKKRIGRNTLCPCGSGKKYKNCCGR